MTLAGRVSSFFLAALAVLLLGNSVLLHAVASAYLHHRFDEQLRSALQTLVAAVEVEDDDVKWEPDDHTVTLGSGRDAEEIRWMVVAEGRQIVDSSRNLASEPERAALRDAVWGEEGRLAPAGTWKLLRQSLAAPHPKPAAERSSLEFDRLTVVAARDRSPLNRTLWRLDAALVAFPLFCWTVAAIGGRWFCQRAIAPVRDMAARLREIRGDDTQTRLPVAATGDELQELGNAFNQLLDQIFLGYERQRQFAGDAAHQLRTPLTILQGQVDVARRRPRTAAEYEQTLDVVRQEVGRLRQTIESLLFLARTQDDQPPPDVQPVELPPWLETYMVRWQSHARFADLHVQSEPGLAWRTSPGLLTQLLDLLVDNALKYSLNGSPVEVRFAGGEGGVCLTIANEGFEIPTEDREAIFAPFFRTREARQSGIAGTGLGLALARRISETLGCQLTCESRNGHGTTFHLRTMPVQSRASLR